jgi:Domain of unknown function (DUF4388)
MQIHFTGYLSEYSLAEIFNFIQAGNKTGILSIEPKSESDNFPAIVEELMLETPCYFVSFQRGRIMSIFHGLKYENQDLLAAIAERQWIAAEQIQGLRKKLSQLMLPWGLHLKILNVISSEQIRLLFETQVISKISKIFEIEQGRFNFDPKAELNYPEMTGLSLYAKDAVLLGLRQLKNWSGLTNKLPNPNAGLQRLSSEPRGLKLENDERLVWQLAIGKMSIREIAAQLDLEIDKVRQIGFRLCSIGVMYEVELESLPPPIEIATRVGGGSASVPVSTSFLSNLVGFLRKNKG